MSEPFFKTDCPSCGAPVHAHSATAVTLVCGYCNSMLVRQDHTLIDTGRDSALLEDFSPLQIGVRGRFATQSFTLVGACKHVMMRGCGTNGMPYLMMAEQVGYPKRAIFM